VFLAVEIQDAHLLWMLASCAAPIFASYVHEYAVRAVSVINYPSLLNLPRRHDEVWDALAVTPELGKAAACGHRDESAVRRSAQIPVRTWSSWLESGLPRNVYVD